MAPAIETMHDCQFELLLLRYLSFSLPARVGSLCRSFRIELGTITMNSASDLPFRFGALAIPYTYR